MSADARFLRRALELARRGQSRVMPNPPVGALVVHNGRILGEGYHRAAGEAHAEVNALNAVAAADRPLLPASTLYVTLEPCNHQGRTPPCTERILADGIGRVVIGCRDPNAQAAGGGIERLQAAGVAAELAGDPAPFWELIRPFALSILRRRPYVHLKWAETVNGVLGQRNGPRIKISSAPANGFVHRLRASLPGVMVGRETVALDNPRLSLRLQPGPQPVRIIWDAGLSLPRSRHVFRPEGGVIVLNRLRDGREGNICYLKPDIAEPANHLAGVLAGLYERCSLGGVLVEGGRQLLSSFLEQGVWDDLSVIQAPHRAGGDVLRPALPPGLEPHRAVDLPPDRVLLYRNDNPG